MHQASATWRTFCIAVLVAWCATTQVALAQEDGDKESLKPTAAYENFAQPLVEQFCVDCHSGDAPEAGLSMEKIDGGERFQHHRDAWKQVAARLRAGDMPPADYDSPTEQERQELIAWVDARLAEFDCSGPIDPGWVTLRRLNRMQYRNTIRDLLSVDFEPNETFPPDELAYGFDNNGDVLTLTPRLLEKYLAAAQTIAGKCFITPESLDGPAYNIKQGKWRGATDRGREGEPQLLYTNGRIEFDYEFPTKGRYLLRATVEGMQAGDEPVRMAFVEDGAEIKTVDVYAERNDPETLFVEIELPAGKRTLGVAFVNDYYKPARQGRRSEDRNMYVHRLEVVGPIDRVMRDVPAAQRRWFSERPTVEQWRDRDAWRPLAEETLQKFLTATYRRPPSDQDVARLIELAEQFRTAGDSFERAMQQVLQVALVSPKFLFIGNLDLHSVDSTGRDIQPIDDYELASRLSYFLWSSKPDKRLMQLASEGKLRNQLAAEVKRLLRDRRSVAFIESFAGQWLGTRLLATIEPDGDLFADFDPSLRSAMQREAEMVFADVVRQDLPITTLLDADFTYANARLAEHYGFPEVQGNHFRRVSLTDLPAEAGVRGGVFTMAGVLAVTSNPNRTSPVKRGKWILGDLLGAEPPPPPPEVPGLDESKLGEKPKSIEEQLANHRADPSCAVCHAQMDPLGLSLEQYDAIGRWRGGDRGEQFKSAGEMPDGRTLSGVDDLKRLLMERSDEFRSSFAEKMLIYALGRGLEYYDECAVKQIAKRVEGQDDRMQALILAIVESEPFQKRRPPAGDVANKDNS